MITKYNKYNLIQEKSTFSNLLPNKFVSYIYKNYKVSDNKFKYKEVDKADIFRSDFNILDIFRSGLTVVYLSSKYDIIISIKSPDQFNCLTFFKNENIKEFKPRTKKQLLDNFLDFSVDYKLYVLDVVIQEKNDNIRVNISKYRQKYLTEPIIENVIKILPRYRHKNITYLKNEISKYVNEISTDSNLIINHLHNLTSDLETLGKTTLDDHFLYKIKNYISIIDNIIERYLNQLNISFYDNDFIDKVKDIKDLIITKVTKIILHNFFELKLYTIQNIDIKIQKDPSKVFDFASTITENPDLWKKYKHFFQAKNFDII